MRPKVVAAILGLVLTIGGVGGLAYGVLALSGTPGGSCSGDDCLADPLILALPLGIVAMVFGLIIAAWALGSLRQERGPMGPLRAFGFMSGLGVVFVAMGGIFLSSSSGGDEDGSLLFVGALFGVMGLCFIAVDLWRFRGEVKKDRLRLSGLKGTARVVEVHDTNVTVNNSPMVKLDLEVTVPGQSPFRTSKRTVISRLSVGALTPGTTVAVLADPNKPHDIVLDWEAGTTPPAGSSAFGQGLPTWFSQGNTALFGGTGSPMNAEVLRRVSQALQAAATRAENGGPAGITPTADGATVIDGGTTVMVNGRQVAAADLGDSLAGLPGVLAAAFGSMAAGSAGSPSAVPGPSASPVPSLSPTADTSSSPAAGSGFSPGIPLPGSTAGTDGLPARVNLDTIQDTGVDIAGNRLYTFDLTVSVAGRQPYQTKHAAVVPRAQVTRLLRGASFPAQVDPSQPGQISIAWDR